jgi:hypothetical protein
VWACVCVFVCNTLQLSNTTKYIEQEFGSFYEVNTSINTTIELPPLDQPDTSDYIIYNSVTQCISSTPSDIPLISCNICYTLQTRDFYLTPFSAYSARQFPICSDAALRE